MSRTAQTGIVTSSTTTQGGKTATASYQYDAVGRLKGATVDNWRFNYSFDQQDAACVGSAGYNPNAHKNGNRTRSTKTNTLTSETATTSNCYNYADQLVSSTDVQVGTPTYDSHGNITQLTGNGTPITFTYNAQDQNTAISQGGNKVEYTKDAGGNVLVKKEYRNGTLDKVYRNAGGVMLACNTSNPNECGVADKYIGLPSGVMLTISSTSETETEAIYSIQNFHGDTALTVGANGRAKSSVYMYDPFGQVIDSATFGTSSTPENATGENMGWATHPSRKQESMFSLALVQMGARVYAPSMGRFLQVDPVEGGTPNAYTYVLDPVKYTDYNGQWGIPKWVKTAAKVVAAAAVVMGVVVVVIVAAPIIAASGAGAAIAAAGAAVAAVAVRAAPVIARVASKAVRTAPKAASGASKGATKVSSASAQASARNAAVRSGGIASAKHCQAAQPKPATIHVPPKQKVTARAA